VLPVWRLHRHIGIGEDLYVEAVADEDVERTLGDALRDGHARAFAELRDECEPLEGARELVEALKERGLQVVLASSSGAEDIEFFLERIGVKDIVDGWTTKDDVESTKPKPDLVQAAAAKAGADEATMVGDAPWDVESARRAGIQTVCVITGGFAEQELRDAGAIGVFDSLVSLRASLDETPLGRR
jgi:HAD superfamily hydrolase (TIGR01509 family)